MIKGNLSKHTQRQKVRRGTAPVKRAHRRGWPGNTLRVMKEGWGEPVN